MGMGMGGSKMDGGVIGGMIGGGMGGEDGRAGRQRCRRSCILRRGRRRERRSRRRVQVRRDLGDQPHATTGNMTAREVGREPTLETMEGGEVARWRGDAATNACGAVAGEGKAPEVYALLSCRVPHRVRVAERDDGAALAAIWRMVRAVLSAVRRGPKPGAATGSYVPR